MDQDTTAGSRHAGCVNAAVQQGAWLAPVTGRLRRHVLVKAEPRLEVIRSLGGMK